MAAPAGEYNNNNNGNNNQKSSMHACMFEYFFCDHFTESFSYKIGIPCKLIELQ